MLTSTCGMQHDGHASVTDVTRVKSSKVRAILPRDCHAKLHAIMGTISNVHWEGHTRATSDKRGLEQEQWSPKDPMKLQGWQCWWTTPLGDKTEL